MEYQGRITVVAEPWVRNCSVARLPYFMVPNERSGPLLHVRGLIFEIRKKIEFLWPLKVGSFLRNWAVEIVVLVVVDDAITFGYA